MEHICIRALGTFTGLVLLATAATGCDRDEAEADRELSPREEPGVLSPAAQPRHSKTTEELAGETEQSAERAVPGVAEDTATAVEQITAARCAREERCGNIGSGRDYSSKVKCELAVREEWEEDLNARECRGGVVLKEFTECLNEIRNEDCSAPFDTLARVLSCRETDICKSLALR